MLRFRRFLLLLAALCAPTLVAGGAHAASGRAPSIDPKIGRAIDTGLLGAPRAHRARYPRQSGSAPVLIELDAPATPAMLAALRGAGAKLTEVDGTTLSYDRFVPAHVSAKTLAALAATSGVHRVSLASGSGPPPLDHSAALIDLADARGSRPALDLMTGAGVTVADVDTLVDPFHPTFFRGDAGYFDWIDVDHDGQLTPGTDAIDLNRDGKVDPGETAQLLEAQTVDFYGQVQPARSAAFDPTTDWLYLDTNGNMARDYGAAAGFTDATPALGEPLFVPDDVNQNGKVDVGERVVRLGTSKFKAIFVDLAYKSLNLSASHVYTRGVDLASFVTDYSKGAIYGYDDAYHATGVQTIIAGDVPLVARRWVGMAPDADLLVAWDIEDSEPLPVNGATWALSQNPDVMLYEMAPWTGNALDGSDPMSMLVDASSTSVTHTCPTGDEGSAGKHTSANLAAGAGQSFGFSVPTAAPMGYPAADQSPIGQAEIALDITMGTASTVTLTSPASDVITLDLTQTTPQTGTLAGGALYYATVETTSRNTQFVDAYVYENGTTATTDPPAGEWSLHVVASTAMHLDAYLDDDVSSWGVGVEWDAAIANDRSLVGIPSVADHCIAVGAHPGHVATSATPWYEMWYGDYNVPANYAEAQGQVRAYSPLGPRIDGVQKPDVLAPDNPWVGSDHVSGQYEKAYASFNVFGGTSGASPHVTGVAALLAQTGLHSDAARDALRTGAWVDTTTGAVPNPTYGYGRLNAAGAFGVTSNEMETGAPSITLAVSPSAPTTAGPAEITPTVEGADGGATGLQVKWDDGYDGTWDTAYAAPAPHEIMSATAADVPFKARVRDAAGHVAEAVIWVKFTEATQGNDAGADGGADAGTGRGDAGDAGDDAGGGGSSSGKGGCSCRAAGAGPHAWPASPLGVLLAAAAIRRRRSARVD
jgi:hypothetical protein